MDISKSTLAALKSKLSASNKNSVYLNALPFNSNYKIDLDRLSLFNNDLPEKFIETLLTRQKFKFRIRLDKAATSVDNERLEKIQKKLNKIFNQSNVIESDIGINTFGFGYPLYIQKNPKNDKLIVAPLLIWNLRLKRISAFEWCFEKSEDDGIVLNEVLLNFLKNDSNADLEFFNEELNNAIDVNKLISICSKVIQISKGGNFEELSNHFRVVQPLLNPISDEKKYESSLILNKQFVSFSGVFSIFKKTKHSIINVYNKLLEKEHVKIDLSSVQQQSFNSLSSIKTDPSQQHILNTLKEERNIVIQGPPGTGKSRTLTSILVNALDNGKTALVVCEKQTALNVLKEQLDELGLSNHYALIQDEQKDRRKVVTKARDLYDARHDIVYNIEEKQYADLKKAINRTIDDINRSAFLTNEITDNGDTRAELIAKLLYLVDKHDFKREYPQEFIWFELDDFPLNEFIDFLDKVEPIYKELDFEIEPFFLKEHLFFTDNPFQLQLEIQTKFEEYINIFYNEEGKIQKVLNKYPLKSELKDEASTSSFLFQFLSVFSTKKKELISDQLVLYKELSKLVGKINGDGLSAKYLIKDSIAEMLNSITTLLEYYKENKEKLFQQFLLLVDWFKLQKKLSELGKREKNIFDYLKKYEDWSVKFLSVYYDRLIIRNGSNDLPRDSEYLKLVKSLLNKVAEYQIPKIQYYWTQEHRRDAYYLIPNNKHSLSFKQVYMITSSSKRKKLSLRQIIDFNIYLFRSFFPIILTTPEVACNIFPNLRKDEKFDFVLFDEASQLRIEDTLPSMLMAKQIIISGDEHQMPPSKYFETAAAEKEDSSPSFENIVESNFLDAESLLDFAENLDFKNIPLDFHYRSKHPQLIDFSNHAFYKRRLVPEPSTSNIKPIKYYHVEGVFDNGVNIIEANKVIQLLQTEINADKFGAYPSVGIATFNVKQRDLIVAEINKLKSENSAFANKIVQLELNGLFVKNLENIQGDERDIMIISCCYGRNSDGKFRAFFGPINQQKGYKLLNVLITRAKYQIQIISSIPEKRTLNYMGYLAEVGENNRKGIFFAYLAYAKAVSEDDEELRKLVLENLLENTSAVFTPANIRRRESEFANYVAEFLGAAFPKATIQKRVLFGGFKIDILLEKDNNRIAIDCDGVEMEPNQEAYLQNVHRQEILEKHGFIFHRIWSVNWWIDTQTAKDSLADFIKSCS